MTTEQLEQMAKIKEECHILAEMLHYERIRIEYNSHKKIRDKGKLVLMPLLHYYSS
jgi:hypothetical protein